MEPGFSLLEKGDKNMEERKARKNPVLLGWNFPWLTQEKYKMSWEHFVPPQSKEVLGKIKQLMGACQQDKGLS